MEKIEALHRYVEQKESDDIVSCVERMLEEGKVSIGEGDNAEVFIVENEKYGDLCVKRSKVDKQLLVNDEEVEMNIQDDAWSRGVRVPRPLVFLRSKETGNKYIVMERIDGQTIGEVLKAKILPEVYDHKLFWKKVYTQIERMHNKSGMYGEGGIHHRDLHENNIMIDFKTGDPVLIDFGTAAYSSSNEEDEVYRDTAMVLNEKTGRFEIEKGRFKKDLGRAKILEERMEELVLTKSE